VLAEIEYRSFILVPRVQLVGYTRFFDPHARKFLTGQQISCSISISTPPYGITGLGVATYSWSLEGGDSAMAFKNYQYSHATTTSIGKKNLHSRSDVQQSTYAFFTVKDGTITANCALTFALPTNSLWAGGLPNFTAKSPPVESVRPTFVDWVVADGVVNLQASAFQFGAAGAGTNGQEWSKVEYSLLAPFPQEGKGAFCQLITADRHLYRTVSGSYYTHFIKNPWNNLKSLDQAFPYPGTLPAGGEWNLPAKGAGYDSPYQPLTYNANDGGGKPLPAVQGQSTTWIPMARYTWSWYGTAEKQSGVWVLTTPTTGHGKHGEPVVWYDHPEWTRVTFSPFGFIGVP
jgi:hypothetical protein